MKIAYAVIWWKKLPQIKTELFVCPILYRHCSIFLTEKYDKNITNIVQKGFAKKNLMIRLLFDATPYPFSIHNPDISWLFANGVIHNVMLEVLLKSVCLNIVKC